METIKLADLPDEIIKVLKIICPNLYNLNIYYSDDSLDVDFYFDDDPRRDEDGYLGCGIEEFIYGSDTWCRLSTIIDVIYYYLRGIE